MEIPHYMSRILRAYELGLPAPAGAQSDIDIKHDYWCPMLHNARICRCQPDLIVTLADGRKFQIFHEGKYILLDA